MIVVVMLFLRSLLNIRIVESLENGLEYGMLNFVPNYYNLPQEIKIY